MKPTAPSSAGPPPYGFRWEKGRLVQVEEAARTVVRLFELFVEKRNRQAVAMTLNGQGQRTARGSKWTDMAVYRCLTNEAYIGRHFTHKTTLDHSGRRVQRPSNDWLAVPCEPIVNLPLWKRVQEILAAQDSGVPIPRNTDGTDHTFDGLLRCACGANMKPNPRGRRYVCPKCKVGIDADTLEDLFESELLDFLRQRWDAFSEILSGDIETAAKRERLRTLRRSRARLREDMKRAADYFLRNPDGLERFGSLDAAARLDAEAIDTEIRAIERALDAASSGATPNTVPMETGIEEVRHTWRLLDPEQRHSLASSLVESVVLDGSHLVFSYKFTEFVKSDDATQQNAKPTNCRKSAPDSDPPQYIRLPKQGEPCEHTGLSRAYLNELVLPTPRNGFNPPVASISLRREGQQRGVRLILLESLLAYVHAKRPEAEE